MQSTTGIESNRRSKPGQLAFIALLLISPILPYVIAIPYNNFLFARAEAEIASLPSYPAAKLVDSYRFHDDRDLCPGWMYHYATSATPENVGIFYESALPRAGWQRADELSVPEQYAKSTTNIRVEYQYEGRIRLTVTTDAFPFFDPRCLQ